MFRRLLASHLKPAAMLIGLALVCSPTVVLAQGGKPAAPKSLRVTAIGSWSVGLAWNAPNGNSSVAFYSIRCSNGHSLSVPGNTTSATFATGLSHLGTFSFAVAAVGSNGKWSAYSNTVTATLKRDTIAPTKPLVDAVGTGPTHVTLSWSSTDECPTLRYSVFVNGAPYYQHIAETTKHIYLLAPNTSYSFTVVARDSAGNVSVVSDPLVVTTPPSDPNDTSPPTTPPNVHGGLIDTTEVWLFWSDSVDNVTPSEFIRYDVYLNGAFEDVAIGLNRSIMYLTPGIVNTVEIYAVDEAGNRSLPVTLTFDLR